MAGKLGPDAFSFYLGLGPGRSYEAVASHYGCSKRAVSKVAGRDNWQQRLHEAEQKVQATAEQKTVESMASVIERHIKTSRFIQSKSLEALRSTPIEKAMDAIRALENAQRTERQLLGSPAAKQAANPFRELSTETLRKIVMQFETQKTSVTIAATETTPVAGTVIDPAPPGTEKP